MRHIIPISGKDSLATALVQRQAHPELSYEYVFNPTGAELPEVFGWLDKVEQYLGQPIARVGENLLEIIEEYNYFLPSRLARYCTRKSKIEPFEEWIGKEPATVYYGIRYDENRGGYDNAKYPNIQPAYPLKEAKIDIDGVYRVISAAGLKPPTFFWQSVYDEVVKIIGKQTLRLTLKEWQIDLLFCWRTRANCYFCFNQRQYEWVGLLEHHPILFIAAMMYENAESEYYWNGKGNPLTGIIEKAEAIKQRRVNKIVKIIRTIQDHQEKAKQISMFDFSKEDELSDFFNSTSCGLFCGK